MLTGDNCKYRFSLERGDLPIKFMGCPILIIEHVYYECINGAHRKFKDNDIKVL